jgi:anti-sigma-K factor RskA
MTAASRKIMEQEPGEIELLLPWYAAGTLSARDTRKVEEALARDPELARQYAVIHEEYAGTIDLNESLGAPSVRAMQKLFAGIDAEPARQPGSSLNLAARVSSFFASLSPRTLAWSASLGALALVLQAGVIAAVLIGNRPATFETASLSTDEPITRNLSAAPAPHALVRFTPDARVSDITALLDKYQASIVDGAKGGMFRLQFANASRSKDEFSDLLGRLQKEKIVSLAVATP